ncbi:hypothetical protein BKA93DRAFT_110786 [Sparassis latifolia]
MHIKIRAGEVGYVVLKDIVQRATISRATCQRTIEHIERASEGQELDFLVASREQLHITRLEPASPSVCSLTLIEHHVNDEHELNWVEAFIIELGDKLSNVERISIHGLDWASSPPSRKVFTAARHLNGVVDLWLSNCTFVSSQDLAHFIRSFLSIHRLHLHDVRLQISMFPPAYRTVNIDKAGSDLRAWLEVISTP